MKRRDTKDEHLQSVMIQPFLLFVVSFFDAPHPLYTPQTLSIYIYLLLFLSLPFPPLRRGASSIRKRLFNVICLEEKHLPVPHHPHLQQRSPLLYMYGLVYVCMLYSVCICVCVF